MNVPVGAPMGAIQTDEQPRRSDIVAPERNVTTGRYGTGGGRSDKHHRTDRSHRIARPRLRWPVLAGVATTVVLAGAGAVVAVRQTSDPTGPSSAAAEVAAVAAADDRVGDARPDSTAVTAPKTDALEANIVATLVTSVVTDPATSVSTVPVVAAAIAEQWHLVGSVTRAVSGDAQGPYTRTTPGNIGAYLGLAMDQPVSCPAQACQLTVIEFIPAVPFTIGGATLTGALTVDLLEGSPCDPVQVTVDATRQADGSYVGTYTFVPTTLYAEYVQPDNGLPAFCYFTDFIVAFTLTPVS